MKLYFTEEQKNADKHRIFLEEEDLTLEGEYIEGNREEYRISGAAIIGEERYPEFTIAFGLEKEVKEETIEDILAEEWDWYDFIF